MDDARRNPDVNLGVSTQCGEKVVTDESSNVRNEVDRGQVELSAYLTG